MKNDRRSLRKRFAGRAPGRRLVSKRAPADGLSRLLSGVHVPIVILSHDRRIRCFTPMAARLLHLRSSDAGRRVSRILRSLDLPDLDQAIAAAMDRHRAQEREVQGPDRHWYSMRFAPYQAPGQRVGAWITFFEVDALKRSQVELRDEHDAVLDTVGALVVVLDREGRIVRFNRASQQTSGYSFEEVKGRNFMDLLLVPEEVAGVKAVFEQLRAGQFPNRYENYWVAKDGRRRLIAWCNTVVLDRDGAVKYVIGTGIDITERQRAEEALQENEAALRRSQEELRALTAGLLIAQEEERRRISRELHDDLNQRLAMLAVEVETLEQQLPDSADLIRGRLRSLRSRTEKLSDDVRRTAYQLHPSILEHLGLAVALKSYCADFSKQEKIKVRFQERSLPAPIPQDVALCLYRVTQECLRNVAKHSGARTALVRLEGIEKGIRLVVSDAGSGFDLELAKGRGRLGIVSMEERVRLLAGSLSIKTRPGDGARVAVSIALGSETS